MVDEIRITESNCCSLEVHTRWARKRLNSTWGPEHRQRFEREIRAIQAMKHPNIICCEGQNLPGQERFYLMRLYPDTLRQRLARVGGWDWHVVAGFGALLADALDYAHDNGFIHRDLKPENILLTNDGTPVIADWGLGYFVHKHSVVLVQLTRGGMGTEYYCSLEQWGTGKCDRRGDIYSLGMLLAELVEGSQRAITVGMGLGNAPVARSGPGASDFNELLWAMTRPFPFQRPGSMAEVSRRLVKASSLSNHHSA
ncbi:MAG: serine/threonine protein kinase [Myxococcales bacterium]|nr:serine/threonine protein kinase [Myxococcales bacterium]